LKTWIADFCSIAREPCKTIAARSVLQDCEFRAHRHARLHQVQLIESGGIKPSFRQSCVANWRSRQKRTSGIARGLGASPED
jgi:hypothetical protein